MVKLYTLRCPATGTLGLSEDLLPRQVTRELALDCCFFWICLLVYFSEASEDPGNGKTSSTIVAISHSFLECFNFLVSLDYSGVTIMVLFIC